MRLLFLIGAFGLFSGVAPILARTQVTPPDWKVRLGLLSVAGMGLSAVSVLVGALLPESLGARGLTDLWHKCAESLRALVADPLGRWTALVAGAVLGVVLARFVWALASGVRTTRRARVRGGLPRWQLGRRVAVYVLPVDQPEAYSVGGFRGQVVITRGLIGVLDDEERRAVLLHEQGHIEASHHPMLLVARAVSAALFKLPPTGSAISSLEQAMEESADDFAARRLGSSATVASGLSKAALAGIRSPVGAMPLGRGPDIPARVRRLLAERDVPGWVDSACLVGVASLFGLIAFTQAIAGPAWISAAHHVLGGGGAFMCPLPA